MPPTDTTPRAAARHLELYRRAGAARRVAIALELSEAVRETTLAGIRRRHPEFSEREVAEAVLDAAYGAGRRR